MRPPSAVDEGRGLEGALQGLRVRHLRLRCDLDGRYAVGVVKVRGWDSTMALRTGRAGWSSGSWMGEARVLLARVREGQVVGSRSAEDDGRGFALAEAVQAGELVRAIGRKSCKVRSAGLRVGCLGASAIRLSGARWTSWRGHTLMLSLGPEGTMHTVYFADFLRG